MRLCVGWIGVALPFVEIIEPILVGILFKSVGVFDGQRIFFEPLVRHRRMHLRVFQGRRHAVRADEMFFRNEQTGARAGFPLQRLLELFRGEIELDCDRRLRGGFRWNCRRSNKTIVELDCAPPNGNGGNEKKTRRSHQHRAIVICLKPVDCFRHG